MLLPVITCRRCVSWIQEWCQYPRSTIITAVGEEDATFTSHFQLPADRTLAKDTRVVCAARPLNHCVDDIAIAVYYHLHVD